MAESELYDGKLRPPSGPFRRPDDYSVAVWRVRGVHKTCVLEACFAYVDGKLDTRRKAAEVGLRRAKERGHLVAGDGYEIDVSEDASDEWETSLTGSVRQEQPRLPGPAS